MGRIASILGLVSLLAVGGCISQLDANESMTSLRSVRSEVVAAIKEVGAELHRTVLASPRPRVSTAPAAAPPTASLEYRGGGKVVGGPDSLTQRVRKGAVALESGGWQRTDAGESPFPYANLEKGGLRVKLGPDPLRDSEAMSFGISGECIRMTDEQAAKSYPKDTIEVPAG